MSETEKLARFDLRAWPGSVDPALRDPAAAALEVGSVLVFPSLAFALDADERALVRAAGSDGSAKNISLDPATGVCKGSTLESEALGRLAAMLDRFGRQAQGLVAALEPGYAAGLVRGRTSFRPTEIKGRSSSWRKDDRRLHVDAFPSRPTRGRRILRVFCNIDPEGRPRIWRVGPDFETYARQFLPGFRPPLPGQAWLLHRVGVTRGVRSRYDAVMLFLHDAAKRDLAWQRSAAAEEVAFAPGTTWMTFTDQVPHAALAGCHALEQTFHVAPEALAQPAQAPLGVLERLCGRALV
jgi:hypothetical protein